MRAPAIFSQQAALLPTERVLRQPSYGLIGAAVLGDPGGGLHRLARRAQPRQQALLYGRDRRAGRWAGVRPDRRAALGRHGVPQELRRSISGALAAGNQRGEPGARLNARIATVGILPRSSVCPRLCDGVDATAVADQWCIRNGKTLAKCLGTGLGRPPEKAAGRSQACSMTGSNAARRRHTTPKVQTCWTS